MLNYLGENEVIDEDHIVPSENEQPLKPLSGLKP